MATQEQTCPSGRSPWTYYEPSLPLAAVGIGLFTITTGVHLIRMLRTRTWDNSFMVLGGTCQLIGYISRLYASQNVCSKSAYGAQSVLLLLGPTLLMFTVALTHTEFIKALNAEGFAWVPALRLQRPVYLGINSLLLILQLIAGVMLATATTISFATIGSDLLIASYVTQMVFWGFLLAENTWVTFKLGKSLKSVERANLSTSTSNDSSIVVKERFSKWKWWAQLFGLAISIIGFGRNLMRLTELGVDFLKENEWTSYAFDGYQMVVVMCAWAVFYLPGKCSEVLRAHQRYQGLGYEMS